MSTAIGSRFFGLTAALACCFSQTLAQDVPGQKLGKLRFCDSPYEIVVVTNDDSLWESRVKTNTCFELYALYTLDPSWSPRPARIEGRLRYVMKVASTWKAGNIGSRSVLRSSIMTLLPIGARGPEARAGDETNAP